MNSKIITVPTSSLDAARKAYGRIIRAAKRLGVEMNPDGMKIVWETKRELTRKVETLIKEEGEINSAGTSKYLVEVVDVELQIPNIGASSGAWRVAGIVCKVDHEEGSIAPEENEIWTEHQDVRDRFRSAKLFCDHCKVNRFRVRTIVCREVATNRLVQVGVECGQHYVRDAEKDVKALEFQEFVTNLIDVEFGEDEGACWGGARRLRALDAEDTVAMVLRVIRDDNGYVASSIENKYGDKEPNPHATWRKVLDRLTHPEPGEISEADKARYKELARTFGDIEAGRVQIELAQINCLRSEMDRVTDRMIGAYEARKLWLANQPTDADYEQAGKVLAWLAAAEVFEAPVGRDLTFEERRKLDGSEFLRSLKTAFAPGWISDKRLAFGACVTRAYDRAMAEAAKVANPPTDKAPEGRVTVEGTVISTRHVEDDFGGCWKMLVELSTRARVWCSVPGGCAGRPGETVKFTATFTRSDKDEFFSFGSRPKLFVEKPAKVKKSKAAAEQTLALI